MAGSTKVEIASQLGKTAVVTGATGGLGYETALALAKAGADVVLIGRDDQNGRSAVEKIGREAAGAKASYEHLDLASLQAANVDAVHGELVGKGVREGLAPVTLGEVARISMILNPDGNWIELSRRASIVGNLS